MSLGYATSDRGGCHMRTYPIADEIVGGTLPPDTLEGKAEKIIVGQPGRGHHRPELQLRQVQRHLVRLLGGHAGADRADLQARLEARVQRGRDLPDRRAHLEPRAPVQPARGRRARRHPAEALRGGGRPHRRGLGRQGHRRPTTFKAALQEFYQICAAGTRTACPARPSSPSSASTCASDGVAPREGRTDATRDDHEQEVHRLPHVRAGLLRLPRGRLPAVGRAPLRRGATRPPAPSRATPACRPAAPSARRPAPTTPS